MPLKRDSTTPGHRFVTPTSLDAYGAILYWFGRYAGATLITGFALTLFIGVAVSFITAITVTRTLLRVIVGTRLANPKWWFGIEHDREMVAANTSSAAD